MIPIPKTEVYTWRGYRCSYQVYPGSLETPPLLLIHPLGVGLAGWFWERFCQAWYDQGQQNPIYNPDLLGCGQSDQPVAAYTPQDWADQLADFVHQVIQRPVVVVAQGATLPIALKLLLLPKMQGWVRGLVLSGPPGWRLITTATPPLAPASPLESALYWTRGLGPVSLRAARSIFAILLPPSAIWLRSGY